MFNSIEALAIAFNLAAGVDPSALPIASNLFTKAVACSFASDGRILLSKDLSNLTK